MRPEDKKYVWWGLLGIGVAALFYFLNVNKSGSNANTVTVPYLVPQTMGNSSSPSSGPSLSDQSNIVGSSPNSTVPNFTNPYSMNVNPAESPGQFGWTPNLMVYNPAGPYNNVQFGGFGNQNSWTLPSLIKTPDNSGSGVQANPYNVMLPQ